MGIKYDDIENLIISDILRKDVVIELLCWSHEYIYREMTNKKDGKAQYCILPEGGGSCHKIPYGNDTWKFIIINLRAFLKSFLVEKKIMTTVEIMELYADMDKSINEKLKTSDITEGYVILNRFEVDI